MSLSAGKLRHVIRIERNIPAVDSAGGRIDSWVAVARKIYASIEPLSARELIASRAEQSEVTARITIRARGGIEQGMRAIHATKYGDVIYHIQGVVYDPESGQEWITLPVSTGIRETP